MRPSNMDEDFLDAFLQAFEFLPYDVLWKFDGDNLERIPKNLKIQKWFPQRDLLRTYNNIMISFNLKHSFTTGYLFITVHHNVKAFVTQGGLQSSDEAIDAGVPLIGIPMLADQWYNVNKYVELGIGVQINALTMTADDLTQAVEKIVNDTR